MALLAIGAHLPVPALHGCKRLSTYTSTSVEKSTESEHCKQVKDSGKHAGKHDLGHKSSGHEHDTCPICQEFLQLAESLLSIGIVLVIDLRQDPLVQYRVDTPPVIYSIIGPALPDARAPPV